MKCGQRHQCNGRGEEVHKRIPVNTNVNTGWNYQILLEEYSSRNYISVDVSEKQECCKCSRSPILEYKDSIEVVKYGRNSYGPRSCPLFTNVTVKSEAQYRHWKHFSQYLYHSYPYRGCKNLRNLKKSVSSISRSDTQIPDPKDNSCATLGVTGSWDDLCPLSTGQVSRKQEKRRSSDKTHSHHTLPF